MLGLTFANESDYDKVKENDTFNFIDLESFSPGKPLSLELVHDNGVKEIIMLNHTYNDQQIEWFKAGSALNLIKLEAKAK
jgi:aconitate hydratase